MTKREVINYLADKLEEMWQTYSLPTEFNKRHEAYVEMKMEVAKQGYIGDCFTQLYNEACKIHARRMGVCDNHGNP